MTMQSGKAVALALEAVYRWWRLSQFMSEACDTGAGETSALRESQHAARQGLVTSINAAVTAIREDLGRTRS